MDLFPMPAEYGATGGSSRRCTVREVPSETLSRGWCWFRGLTGRNAGHLFGGPSDGFLHHSVVAEVLQVTGPVSCFTLHVRLGACALGHISPLLLFSATVPLSG